MTEYAPQTIEDLFNQIQAGIPSALMAGIIGDQAHDGGYHRGRHYVSSGDYSVQYSPQDTTGDGEAACALDISWGNAQDQYTVSQRLLDAQNDPRMGIVREFYGSTDGWNVCGWDYAGGYAVTSDPSHLWHIHVSLDRLTATSDLSAVAAVITGGTTQPEGDDELNADQDNILRQTYNYASWINTWKDQIDPVIRETYNNAVWANGKLDTLLSDAGMDEEQIASFRSALEQQSAEALDAIQAPPLTYDVPDATLVS